MYAIRSYYDSDPPQTAEATTLRIPVFRKDAVGEIDVRTGGMHRIRANSRTRGVGTGERQTTDELRRFWTPGVHPITDIEDHESLSPGGEENESIEDTHLSYNFV